MLQTQERPEEPHEYEDCDQQQCANSDLEVYIKYVDRMTGTYCGMLYSFGFFGGGITQLPNKSKTEA